MLIIGRRYRIKSEKELLASGWRMVVQGYYNHPKCHIGIAKVMVDLQYVVIKAKFDGGHYSGDSPWNWHPLMLVLEENRRNLPAWF